MITAYLCHPVAPPCACASAYPRSERDEEWFGHSTPGQVVACNVASARRWLRWAIRIAPHVAWCANWLLYVDLLDDTKPEERAIGMAASHEMASRCDVAVLVGGRISSGMRMDADHCRGFREWATTFDLTHLGCEPPALHLFAANDLPMPLRQR